MKKKIMHIHFTGIKGVGMTPLSIIAKEAGFKVSGSDIKEEFITDEPLKKAGIVPFTDFLEENIKGADLLITTGAHGGFNNVEVQKAKEKNIPVLTQGEAVGVFMDGEIFGKKFEGISVAGCHGKTTTTAMIAAIFKESGLDPSYVIGGGNVIPLGVPGHFGKGKYFIAEADEYATEPVFDKTVKFLWQNPRIAVFTNIEFDHPDLFVSVDQVRNEFLKFAKKLPSGGVLIAGGDDDQIKKLLQDYGGRVTTFGFSPINDYVLKRVSISGSQTFFWVETKNITLGEFSLGVLGEHNALNALAAVVTGLECGISINKIKSALGVFGGAKRRFEYIRELEKGALLFDDYAHHPTEIRKTLRAFRQSFPKSKIVCIFQPHTYSRTKTLFEQFVHSFIDCDTVIISNIYPSLRESPDLNVSSQLLINNISRYHKDPLFLPGLSDVIEYINQKGYGKDTVVITMGAGDIYKINEKLK
ncbi:MAG: UDP-N-acetylmuramate--L-alanine ligase [Candidatus Levybacteria bacterium]|nr:UDP-N-acetylmuramate--L-alanine ligase [Candidatus Levybacteria bacterium]